MPPINSSENQSADLHAAPALPSEMLRRIVDSSPDCIETFDAAGKWQWMNSGGQGALGITDFAALNGAEWAALWVEDTQAQARQAADAANREIISFRGQRRTAAGNLRWRDVTVTPLFDSGGAYTGAFAVSRDITDALQREEAAATLAAVAINTADAIIGFDTQGCITAWNRAAEQMFGYSAQEAVGQSYMILGSENVYAQQHEIFQNVMQGQSVRRYDTRRKRKDGVWIDVSVTTSPLEIGGRIQGASAVLRDTTEQTRIAEELRRRNVMMDALLQGTSSAIYMKDTQGRFLLANPVCLAILDRPAEKVLGFDETQVFDDLQSAEAIMRDDAAIMQSGKERVLEELVPMRGKIHTFLSVKNPMFDAAGNCIGIMGVSTDITERKEHEAEIQDLNARLHRAMQETHHRVKNNLQVISALTEMQAPDPQGTVPASALLRIGQHVRALAGIHDLLTHQIKADARNELISTKEILDKLVYLLQTTLKARPITYHADDVRLTMEQSSSFAMLVSELISNAVKHGSGGIELNLTRQETDGGDAPPCLRLEVCDDGPGFPPAFDPIAAASTGLELVDSLTRWDLRGSITYENRERGGARVIALFPEREAGC